MVRHELQTAKPQILDSENREEVKGRLKADAVPLAKVSVNVRQGETLSDFQKRNVCKCECEARRNVCIFQKNSSGDVWVVFFPGDLPEGPSVPDWCSEHVKACPEELQQKVWQHIDAIERDALEATSQGAWSGEIAKGAWGAELEGQECVGWGASQA